MRFYDGKKDKTTGGDRPFGEKIELKVKVVKPKTELPEEIEREFYANAINLHYGAGLGTSFQHVIETLKKMEGKPGQAIKILQELKKF